MARRWKLEQVQVVPRPRSEVFAFFSDPQNLERITPAFLRFRTLTPPPIEMREGAIMDFRLRLYGVGLRWQTRIERFEPEERFVDTQVKGPYRYWHHLHEFEDLGDRTRVRDTVHYELPLGPLGSLARALFVRRSLERIFNYRRQAVVEIFGLE
jgi:hypothetical protein